MFKDDSQFSKDMFRGLELERTAREARGVRSGAAPREIRRPFWKLARIYHPNLNKEVLWSY